MSTSQTGASTDERPGFLIPGIRCGLEMVMVGALVLLVGLPSSNAFYTGIVLMTAVVAMVVVLFFALNRQMAAWVTTVERSDRPESSALERLGERRDG